jgi:hypothetical protein
MTWELISTAALERFKIDDLLTSGFEPFAVDNGRVWFRRVKPARCVPVGYDPKVARSLGAHLGAVTAP